jgi:hypothetical protein
MTWTFGKNVWLSILVAAGGACLAPRPAMAQDAAPAVAASTNLVLGNSSMWRRFLVLRKPVVREGGQLKELRPIPGDLWRAVDGTNVPPNALPVYETPAPAANWAAAEFDDSAWSRATGPFFPSSGWAYCKEVDGAGFCVYEGITPALSAICLRGKFLVNDPARAGEMKLALDYRGGVVVYLNGKEIARAGIPDAEKGRGLEALAEDYPLEAYVTDEGKIIRSMYGDPAKYVSRVQQRIRKLRDVVLPPALLRKGVNVLAVEAHSAPYHEAAAGKSTVAHYENTKGYVLEWVTVGVPNLALTGADANVPANVGRPAGVQVWNQDTFMRVKPREFGDPCEPLRPIRLTGARNSAFSGAVVVGAPATLRGVKAVAGDLTGPGTIPAAGIQVRYGVSDKDTGLAYDILQPDPPAEVAPEKNAGALLPVWVTVAVPADARPGEYKGKLTVTAEGAAAPIEVPVALRVVDWRVPDSKEFVSHIGLTESPETLAMQYKVPLWSPEHWALVDKAFAMMGQVGADDVFLTLLRRTHHGNEHGMIRWVRQPGGALKPDLSIAEKYLDTAIKHLGKVPVVCVYCWEPYTGSSYLGGKASAGKGLPYSIYDPATNGWEGAEGPAWGSPEVRPFLQPVFDGLREMLKKRGLENALLVGVAGDNRPNKDAVEDLRAVAPEAKWMVQSHARADSLHGQPVGYLAEVWNCPSPPNPAEKHEYGWKNPQLRMAFPRYNAFTLLMTGCTLAQYRVACESASTSGIRGFGRVGADFWNVLQAANKTYGSGHNLIARYPESDWGQLYLGNSTPYLLAPGPQGPIATARFEMIREGARDLEARVFLEKALLDPALKAKLGDDLAGRCQQLLDERVRAILIGRPSWTFFAGAPERLDRLYTLTAEAAARLAQAPK